MIRIIMNGGCNMPNIKPISDLRNYTAVINEVTYGNRVYLTRNGHGQCAIIDMKELDELDKLKALHTLMNKIMGLLLFLLPPALQFIEIKYSFAVVCIIATIAAIQELCYIVNDK